MNITQSMKAKRSDDLKLLTKRESQNFSYTITFDELPIGTHQTDILV